MNESQLWSKLEKALPNADMTRHEDRTRRFIPDVSFALDGVDGWIELKAYDAWPSDNIPKFRNFTPGQRNWLRRRGEAGSGHCFVLAAVERDLFLFGWWSVEGLGIWRRGTMIRESLWYTRSGKMDSELKAAILTKRDSVPF